MDAKQPTVSAAMTTYNGQAFLREQLDSILAQTCPPDEIIICDDCSSDGTMAILEEYQHRFPNQIQLFQNSQNLGYIKNFERAISLCSCDLIALSDQDDVWLPTKLQKMVETFARLPAVGLIFSEAIIVDGNLHPSGRLLYASRRLPDLRPGYTVASLLGRINIKGCTIAFRSSLQSYMLPIATPGWGHDHWLVFVTAVISTIHYLEEPLMMYRRHGSNWGNDPRNKSMRHYLKQLPAYLSIDGYQREVDKWERMTTYLESLCCQTNQDSQKACVIDALVQVKKRAEFSRRRYLLRRQRRWLRLAPASSLLFNGQYRQYERGVRTFVRDLLV